MKDLFPIRLEVEEALLGKVLRSLRRLPGIAMLSLDLDEVGPKKLANGAANHSAAPPPTADSSKPRAHDLVVAFLLQSGPQHLQAIRNLLTARGFAGKSAANTVLNVLRKQKITEAGDGYAIHKLTDSALASLRQQAQEVRAPNPALPAPGGKKKNAVTGKQAILDKMRSSPGQDLFTRAELIEAIVAAGLAKRSIDGAVGKLKDDKLIRSPEAGSYELTAKGKQGD
jgi:acetylornithine deacetylase/succinyl-diaminopimelate desuccinylase-like protein